LQINLIDAIQDDIKENNYSEQLIMNIGKILTQFGKLVLKIYLFFYFIINTLDILLIDEMNLLNHYQQQSLIIIFLDYLI